MKQESSEAQPDHSADLKSFYRPCDVKVFVGRFRKRKHFLWEEVDLRKIVGRGPILIIPEVEEKD